MMKISNDTLSILQNYAVINNSIAVKPGNVLRTISPQKTLLSKAEVGEVFGGKMQTWKFRFQVFFTKLSKIKGNLAKLREISGK